MTHAWMSILSIIMAAVNFGATSPEAAADRAVSEEQAAVEYVVIERVHGSEAIIETRMGLFRMPCGVLPEGACREGNVIEWRVSEGERGRRIAQGQARLARMASADIAEI